jgi:FkbM family methyltransferase
MALKEIHSFISDNLNPDSVIFEVGVHIGTDTEKIYELSGSNNIYGFEPDPRNIQILEKRNRISIFKEFCSAALSNEKGSFDFYLSSGNPPEIYEDPDMNLEWSASNSLKKPKKHLDVHSWCKFDYYTKVETLRLDDFCHSRGIKFIDFIWMDVQGAEDLVIKGMGDMKPRIRYIYTEFNDDEMYEGSLNMEGILSILGDGWEIIEKYENDVLLENKKMLI